MDQTASQNRHQPQKVKPPNFFVKLVKAIRRRLKLLIIIAIIFLVGGLIFIKATTVSTPNLTFEHPQLENLSKTLTLSGKINAKKQAKLRFVAGGKIVYLGAEEGSLVKKRQTIATIDQRDLQKRLQKDLNNYMKERWDWEERLDDTKDRTIDKTEEREKDKAQWDLNNTVLDVEIQDIAISNTVMSAPFAGILVTRPVQSTGITVMASDYFELIDPNSLYFSAEVDEEDVALIQNNQTGQLQLDAYPDETVNTYVSFIAFKATETANGTVFVVEFPLQDWMIGENQPFLMQKYRLGMNGDVEVELARKENVLTIPLIATKERDGKIYVDVKDQQPAPAADNFGTKVTNVFTGQKAAAPTIVEREIEIGLETDSKVEVTKGLVPTDEVVIPE